ncbi:hypothetical protein D3C83_261670 [compost metagenome]
MAAVSRFCVFWITNTIRKVTMVVVVLMTSCQVSLKPKIGPDTPHIKMRRTAAMKAMGRPVT